MFNPLLSLSASIIRARVEFLCWLAVAYVGMITAHSDVLRWPISDHIAILMTLGCVTFLAYRHGGRHSPAF